MKAASPVERMQRLHLILPGDPDTVTGGYIYDRRIVAGLRALQWQVEVHSLPGDYPFPDAGERSAAEQLLAGIDTGELVMIDGLALGTSPELSERHGSRLDIVALVHHPLAAESGLSAAQQAALQSSERAALRHVRHVIVTSAATAEALAEYDVAPGRIAVVEPGTDPAPLARRRGRGDHSPIELLCVATLIPRKAQHLLLEALAALDAQQWRLTLAGSAERNPAYVAQLRQMLQRPVFADRVLLAGELGGADLTRCYQAADLFVLPTLHEGYGMAVAEAIAHGLPVISTRTGGIPRLVPAGAGLLLPPGDAAALHSALAAVLQDPQLLAALGRGAEQARRELRGWDMAAMQMAAILDSVAGR